MGAYAQLSWSGQLPIGESFQHGFWVKKKDNADMSIAEAISAADRWMTNFKATSPGNLMNLYGSGTTWSPAKVVLYDGSHTVVGRGFGTVGAAGTGSSPGNALPPQCAIAVSLRGSGAGPAYRGRYYLPCVYTASLTTAGRIAPTPMGTIAAAVNQANLQLDAVNPVFAFGFYSARLSQFVVASKVNIGDVVDTVRSRRDKLVEARAGAQGSTPL